MTAGIPADDSPNRLKGEVWISSQGTFEQPQDRRHPDVRSPGESRWKFRPDHGGEGREDHEDYTHLTGRTGWLGPKSLLDRLPESARNHLEKQRAITIDKDPFALWINERGTTKTARDGSRGVMDQDTRVRRGKR